MLILLSLDIIKIFIAQTANEILGKFSEMGKWTDCVTLFYVLIMLSRLHQDLFMLNTCCTYTFYYFAIYKL